MAVLFVIPVYNASLFLRKRSVRSRRVYASLYHSWYSHQFSRDGGTQNCTLYVSRRRWHRALGEFSSGRLLHRKTFCLKIHTVFLRFSLSLFFSCSLVFSFLLFPSLKFPSGEFFLSLLSFPPPFILFSLLIALTPTPSNDVNVLFHNLPTHVLAIASAYPVLLYLLAIYMKKEHCN